MKLITQIQSYCATNLYVSTSQKDLIKKRNDLLNYMQSGEVTLTCIESEMAIEFSFFWELATYEKGRNR